MGLDIPGYGTIETTKGAPPDGCWMVCGFYSRSFTLVEVRGGVCYCAGTNDELCHVDVIGEYCKPPAALPPAAPVEAKPIEMPAWPILARWVYSDTGKKVIAVRWKAHDHNWYWRGGKCGCTWKDENVPTHAERIDPGKIIAERNSLAAELEAIKSRLVKMLK